MSFDQATYPFGQSAAVAPADRADFEALKAGIIAEFNPQDFLHALLADEFLHAAWELARGRKYGVPQSFVDRANRNWNRAHKALARLRSFRAVSLNLLENEDAEAWAVAPFANAFAIAKRGRASAAYKWVIADNKKRLEEIRMQ